MNYPYPSKGLLIIAHGSPRKEANLEFKSLCVRVAERLPDHHVVSVFLEGDEPTIEQGFETLATAGLSEITVLPYFLVRGKHTQTDIPRMIEGCSNKHPEIKISTLEPLGLHASIIDLLVSIALT